MDHSIAGKSQGSHKNWERKFHEFTMTFNSIHGPKIDPLAERFVAWHKDS